MKYTEISLTDSIIEKHSDIIIKEGDTADCANLRNYNNNNIENPTIDQAMNKENCVKSTPEKIDVRKQKDTNECIENTFESIIEVPKFLSPKKECLDEQGNSPASIDKILCTQYTMRELQNLLKSEPNSPIGNSGVDENCREILRTPKVDKRSYSQSNSPDKLHPSVKKRKISMSTDSDSKSVKIKPESYDSVFINELEPMQFLHDLDSLIEFEDCKIPSDMLLSSGMFDNIAEDTTGNSGGLDMEQPQDPLSIEEPEEKFKNSPKVVYPARQTRLQTKMKERRMCSPKKSSKQKRDRPSIAKIKEKVEAMKEKEEFSLSVINKLMGLQVKLQHTVPPQHKVESHAGTHVPREKENEEFQKYGPLRKGAFLPTEDEIIQNNWKIFCKVHDWDVKNTEPFLHMKHNERYYISSFQERQKFVQFLANGLPWRTLYSVYSRFKVLHKNCKSKSGNKRFTPKEDKILLEFLKNHSLKEDNKLTYPELAKALGRPTQSIYSRLRILKTKQRMKKSKNPIATKVKWTLPLIEKFIKHLIDITLSENVDELKDAVIPKLIWLKMEDILRISADFLKSFWQYQLHMQLFSPHPIYLNDIKIQLIEYMYGKGVGHPKEINWPGVAKYFDGFTSVYLRKTFARLIRSAGLESEIGNFAGVIEYLYDCGITQILEEHMDQFLPRLRYTNGTIELVDEFPRPD